MRFRRAAAAVVIGAAALACMLPPPATAASTAQAPAVHGSSAQAPAVHGLSERVPSAYGPAAVNADRAVASYRALQEHLGVHDGSELYRERYPVEAGDRPYSYEWPFSQAHAATLDLTGLPGERGAAFRGDLASRGRGQERYWNAAGGTTGLPGYASYPVAPYGSGGDFFYDDNEWVGLLDVQHHLMTGDKAALARAEKVFDLVTSGWDGDSAHAAPGGVFWTQAGWSSDRNTVSNMPGAELGLRLYEITGQRSYLAWALRMYHWTNRYLLSPEGLYWDHLGLDGTVQKTFWSYNQGVPVGVNVLLYRITHDRTYLRRAERIAAAAYDYYVTQGRLSAQPPYFNAIFFKNLLLLESVTKGHTYRDAMDEYAASVWDHDRDPGTGLFTFGGSKGTELLQQAAMTQIYAVLGWDPEDHRLLY